MDVKSICIGAIVVVVCIAIAIAVGVLSAEALLWIFDKINYRLDEGVFRAIWFTFCMFGGVFASVKGVKDRDDLFYV